MEFISKLKQKPVLMILVLIVVIILFVLIVKNTSIFNGGSQNPVNSNSVSGLSFGDVTESNAPTSTIPLETRKDVVRAFQSAYDAMTSNNASRIQASMIARAKTPAEKNLVDKLTDKDLLSLSARIARIMVKPPVDILIDQDAKWTLNGDMVSVELVTENGTTTMSAVKVDGKWH